MTDSAIDRLPCGYLVFADDNLILSVNETLADLLGYEKAELINKHIDTVLTISSRIFYNTHLFPLLRLQGRCEEIFITLLSKTHEHIPVLLNAKRYDEDKRAVNECILVRVNERKKYEEEILAAKRAAEEALQQNETLTNLTRKLEAQALTLDQQVSRLSSMNSNLVEFNKIITHDFQESIRKVELFAGKMMHGGGERDITRIITAAKRLRGLSSALEMFVKLQGEQSLTDVDLNTIVKEAKFEASVAKEFSDFEVTVGTLPVIEGSSQQLKLMFYQLFDNAIEFRKPDTRLKITISVIPLHENIYRADPERYKYVEFVRIVFRDNGRGFDEEYKEYVFGLLKKLEANNLRLGMGLAYVKKVVDNHRGTLTAESTIGEGTAFTITLPVRQS